MSNISFIKDEKTKSPYFVAEINNQQTVFQDYIPKMPHAWHRLRNFINNDNKNNKITKMKVVFRGSEFLCPDNQDGYFFGYKSIRVYPGKLKIDLVGVGYLKDNIAKISWLTQDGSIYSQEERNKESCGFCLISGKI